MSGCHTCRRRQRICHLCKEQKRACEYVGIESRSYELPEDTTQEELEKLVTSLNEDENVDGILVQLPLPGQIDEEKITTMISPKKDVDGFLADSIGRFVLERRDSVLVLRQA